MSEPITCPACGASNPAGATWCNQCFERFREPEPDPPPMVETPAPRRTDHDHPAPATPPPPPTGGEQLALLEDDAGPQTWRCRFCDTDVPVGQVQCPVCQQSIYDSFGGKPETVEVDPTDALRRSILPGGGHFVLQQGLLAATILALTVISLGMGVYLLVIGVTVLGAFLTFIGLTIWMLAAHDAYRIASGQADDIFLRPRVLSVIAGVWFILVIAAAVQAQRVLER